MIPKILHLYWGCNNSMSYIRYLTVVSWIRYNPDWKIRIGCPVISSGVSRHHDDKNDFYCGYDYFNDLIDLPNVEIVYFDWNEFPFVRSEVHRSDIYRWKTLSDEGGWWSDFDIIYIKPMIPIKSFNKSVMMIYKRSDTHPIAFFGCPPNNKHIDGIFKRALNNLQRDQQGQSAGTITVGSGMHEDVEYLPEEMVYPFAWDCLHPMITEKNYNLPIECIGIHWFGGSHIMIEQEKILQPNMKFDMDKNFHRIIKEIGDHNG